MNPGGDFMVVWNSQQDAQVGAVMARRYAADATPLGGEFQVNTTEFGAQYQSDVAFDGDGKAIVVWTSFLQDGSGGGVFGQRLDASGSKLGPEFNVTTFTSGFQGRARVAVAPADDFAVIWQSDAQDGSGVGVFAQHFDAEGKRDGRELPVNNFTADFQGNPVIAAQPNGQFVAAWESFGVDGSSYGISARLAGFPAVQPFLVDAHTQPGLAEAVNLNGVMEPGETVLIETAFKNPSDSPLDLSGTASNLRGLPGPDVRARRHLRRLRDDRRRRDEQLFRRHRELLPGDRQRVAPDPALGRAFDETLSYNGFTRTAALHVGESFPDVATGTSSMPSSRTCFTTA